MSDPSPQQVRAFSAAFCKRFGSRVVSKASAPEMEIAGRFLQAIGVQDAQRFMRFYTTTIGHTIYAPFELGVPSDGWPLWWQLVTIVHENVHVYQWDEHGGPVDFGLGYLVDKVELLRHEALAYASEFDLSHWRSPGSVPDVENRMAPLRDYGCTEAQVQTAGAMARAMGATVLAGGFTSKPAQAAVEMLAATMPELREAA